MSLFNSNTIFDEARRFLDALFKDLEKSRVNLKHWDIDHLCYRVQTLEEYAEASKLFLAIGQLLIESEVNGRMISTYKLFKPINYSGRTIDVIELPAPKLGKQTITGFEHIEVVVDEPLWSLSEQYHHLKQDKGGFHKRFNAELEIIFPSGALKFHHQSLESVVRIEKNLNVSAFLQESQILDQLQEYHPLIAGSYPLDLSVDNSDLDIICDCRDQNSFFLELKKLYSDRPHFNIQKNGIRGENSVYCSWRTKNLTIEIFAQSTQSCRQWGFKHFQIEDRVLKLAGPAAYKKIMQLRSQGYKTEPAFWSYLNNQPIDEETFPLERIYEELYQDSFLSEIELITKYKNIFAQA